MVVGVMNDERVNNVDNFGGLKNQYEKDLITMKKKRNQLILDARAMNMTVNEYKIYKKEKKMRLREIERVQKKVLKEALKNKKKEEKKALKEKEKAEKKALKEKEREENKKEKKKEREIKFLQKELRKELLKYFKDKRRKLKVNHNK